MRWTEGRAWITVCENPRCAMPIVEAHVNGIKIRLSTKAIPVKDALIFQKYERIVINIWKTHMQYVATAWVKEYKTVDKGHLFVQHVHGARP